MELFWKCSVIIYLIAVIIWGWREMGGVDGMYDIVKTVVHGVIICGILFGAYMLIMYGTAYLYGL